jgi:hypothetical protein
MRLHLENHQPPATQPQQFGGVNPPAILSVRVRVSHTYYYPSIAVSRSSSAPTISVIQKIPPYSIASGGSDWWTRGSLMYIRLQHLRRNLSAGFYVGDFAPGATIRVLGNRSWTRVITDITRSFYLSLQRKIVVVIIYGDYFIILHVGPGNNYSCCFLSPEPKAS